MDKHLSERRTEDTAVDLLRIAGWAPSRPPRGSVVRQNEYKAFRQLAAVFAGRSKSGQGDGYPDFLVVARDTMRPLMVIETKPRETEILDAIMEAERYAEACRSAGHPVIAVGIAGQERSEPITVRVEKFFQGVWHEVTYGTDAISWIPRPEDVERLLGSESLMDLAPVVPSANVLGQKADLINRILREADVKDEYRPAYVGAMMLALWKSNGELRRNPQFVLDDINSASRQAFEEGEKPELAKSLHVDEANAKLAHSAWEILATLEKLNVVSASFAHDYLGHLYETFFRYTGGNTIGQYFTPRHITRFMADTVQVTSTDVVIDPACGTGGFLIACMQRAMEEGHLSYDQMTELIRGRLIGYESEPITAALCVANMILRGDGHTGIRKQDVFTAVDYPDRECDVALMNPPFPHRATDVPPQRFVERALESLKTRGKLAVILPNSLLAKKGPGRWRSQILKDNSLVAVCQLPDDLFQPFAAANTSVVVFEKGVPQDSRRRTVFTRIQYDGYALKKGNRVPRKDGRDDLPRALDSILNGTSDPGFSGVAALRDTAEWSPGAYIDSAVPSREELEGHIDELLRRSTSFYVRYAAETSRLRQRVTSGDVTVVPYREVVGPARLRNAANLPAVEGTLGEKFDILYGQKELHSREGIPPGDALIISPTERYNGCYGWLEFEPLLEPPFVTVAQTGSIGEAFVQLEPCAVNDDCLVLLPKDDATLSVAWLFATAAVIRAERWRFSYGRKLTPARIAGFASTFDPSLIEWTAGEVERWREVAELAVARYSLSSAALDSGA